MILNSDFFLRLNWVTFARKIKLWEKKKEHKFCLTLSEREVEPIQPDFGGERIGKQDLPTKVRQTSQDLPDYERQILWGLPDFGSEREGKLVLLWNFSFEKLEKYDLWWMKKHVSRCILHTFHINAIQKGMKLLFPALSLRVLAHIHFQ